MSSKRIRKIRHAPPPRAGWAIDSVLTRNGNIDVRKLYIGPKNVDPEDIVNLMSGVVAAAINTAFPDPADRADVKEAFLSLVSTRIETATEADPPEQEQQSDEEEGEERCQ